jgi:hypothetical protein
MVHRARDEGLVKLPRLGRAPPAKDHSSPSRGSLVVQVARLEEESNDRNTPGMTAVGELDLAAIGRGIEGQRRCNDVRRKETDVMMSLVVHLWSAAG